jgi:hypothetical protein
MQIRAAYQKFDAVTVLVKGGGVFDNHSISTKEAKENVLSRTFLLTRFLTIFGF